MINHDLITLKPKSFVLDEENDGRKLSYLQAIHESIKSELRRDEEVILIGEEARSNVFGTFTGFYDEFGGDRIRVCPVAETGIIGIAAGAALCGMKPICTMDMLSFLYVCMDQVVSIVSKTPYFFAGKAKLNMIIKCVEMYGSGGSGTHVDRNHPMFMHCPGLKIVAPTTPYDVKGLMRQSMLEEDPILYIEDSGVWGYKQTVPEGEYTIPFGKAAIRREGSDVTIVAIGACVMHAIQAAQELSDKGISCEVIDPRSLVPLDRETILKSVAKTGRLVIADPANKTCSAASEISAIVCEEAFESLKGPIARVCTYDCVIPQARTLEIPMYPNPEKIIKAVGYVLK
ncbi:MAG: alpha-ketoacid dehydrogenase subunit beta [Synergistaceae bacterium]|nr:alpha-ketoacid dehydrogenase subunit beta [Synergistaceae bacterium]